MIQIDAGFVTNRDVYHNEMEWNGILRATRTTALATLLLALSTALFGGTTAGEVRGRCRFAAATAVI